MDVIRLPAGARPGGGAPAVAVGNFDGVHRGHQALVRAAVQDARSRQASAVALTFDPHPAQVVAPHRVPARLFTLGQKAEVLAGLGIDLLAVLPFSPAVAALDPPDFAREVLTGLLGAGTVVVGAGFRFGRHRRGTVDDLRTLGGPAGFSVVEVGAVLESGYPVSSTRVREAVRHGDLDLAALLLGRPHTVEGEVTHGEGRGRTLGFPTANVVPATEVLPPPGVYAGWAGPAGEAPGPAVINLGHRPTFGGNGLRLEAHLLDVELDLYGKQIRVAFADKLRDERRFDGADALRAQIAEDAAAARRLLEKAGGTGYSPTR